MHDKPASITPWLLHSTTAKPEDHSQANKGCSRIAAATRLGAQIAPGLGGRRAQRQPRGLPSLPGRAPGAEPPPRLPGITFPSRAPAGREAGAAGTPGGSGSPGPGPRGARDKLCRASLRPHRHAAAAVLAPSPHRWEPGVGGDKLAGADGREPQGALTHTRTPTRACTRTRGARSPRRERRGPRMLPPPAAAPAGWGGDGRRLPGHARRHVPERSGPAVRAPAPRLQGAASAPPLYPRAAAAAAAGRPRWVGTREAAPGPTCARPAGRSGRRPRTRLAGSRAPRWPPGDCHRTRGHAALTRARRHRDTRAQICRRAQPHTVARRYHSRTDIRAASHRHCPADGGTRMPHACTDIRTTHILRHTHTHTHGRTHTHTQTCTETHPAQAHAVKSWARTEDRVDWSAPRNACPSSLPSSLQNLRCLCTGRGRSEHCPAHLQCSSGGDRRPHWAWSSCPPGAWRCRVTLGVPGGRDCGGLPVTSELKQEPRRSA